MLLLIHHLDIRLRMGYDVPCQACVSIPITAITRHSLSDLGVYINFLCCTNLACIAISVLYNL
jgi:hypothetical protein